MKKTSFTDRFFGYAEIKIGQCDSDRCLAALIDGRAIFEAYAREDFVIIRTSLRESAYIKKLLCSDCFEYECEYFGLPRFFYKYKARPGIVVGMVTAILITLYFSTLVWNIEIDGNHELSDSYILSVLEENGLCEGKARGDIDIDSLTGNIMLENGKIGWISVNFRGTTAFVEVLEYAGKSETLKSGAKNIVADRDGRITELEVYSGTAVVSVGDTVKKGDLLVSGISDTSSGYKLKSASAKVIAEVFDEIVIEIPYSRIQKVYTGNTISEKSIKIFGKNIKVLKNSGKMYDKCDIIKKVKRAELFETLRLPLSIVDITYNEYEDKTVTVDKSIARTLAFKELENRLSDLARDSELLSISEQTFEGEKSFTLKTLVYHTAEISKDSPISRSKYVQN